MANHADAADPDAWRGLLRRQAGAVSRTQIHAQGLTDDIVAAHINAGRWQRPLRGVVVTYSGPLARMTELWSAVLCGGDAAALGHETAGELWGLVPQSSLIHVMVPRTRDFAGTGGLVVHRPRRTPHAVGRPPRTTAAATVLDLARQVHRSDQALALVARATQRGLATAADLSVELARRPRQRWRSLLTSAIDDSASGAHSALELRYLSDVERRHGLPAGQRQRRVGNRIQDVHYRGFRTTVELDGKLGHNDTESRWRDMDRDNMSVLRQEDTLRFGWSDVATRPCAVAAQVAIVLKRNGWTGKPRRCGPHCAIGS